MQHMHSHFRNWLLVVALLTSSYTQFARGWGTGDSATLALCAVIAAYITYNDIRQAADNFGKRLFDYVDSNLDATDESPGYDNSSIGVFLDCNNNMILESIYEKENSEVVSTNSNALVCNKNNNQENENTDVSDEEEMCTITEVLISDNSNEQLDKAQEDTLLINDQMINELLSAGETFVYKISPETYAVSLIMKDKNFEIVALNDEDKETFSKTFNDFDSQLNQLEQQYSAGVIQISSCTIELEKTLISSEKALILNGNATIKIADGLLAAPKIKCTGLVMNFSHCFIDANELCLETTSPESTCTKIYITFNKEKGIPTGIQGCIDFANNQTEGDAGLLIMGAATIEIEFSPHVCL